MPRQLALSDPQWTGAESVVTNEGRKVDLVQHRKPLDGEDPVCRVCRKPAPLMPKGGQLHKAAAICSTACVERQLSVLTQLEAQVDRANTQIRANLVQEIKSEITRLVLCRQDLLTLGY